METISIKDSLKISIQTHENLPQCAILTLNGYLDTYNSRGFQQYVQKIVEEKSQHIIINCKNLSYVSSTGIGVFSYLNRVLRKKDGELILLDINASVKEVFKLLGFLSLFKITDKMEEAEEILKKKFSNESSI